MSIPYLPGETVSKLINTLELESNIAIDWFTKKGNDYKHSVDY